jgi:hypothetical protein
MNEEKQQYTSPKSEVVEMEAVTPFLDTFASASQSNSLIDYDNTDVTDD